MRVLQFLSDTGYGGAEMRALERLHSPQMRAFEHHFCMMRGLDGPLKTGFEEAGAHLHYCPAGPGFPARFAKLSRRIRPQVAHANQQWMSAPLLALAKANGIRGRVVQFHASADLRIPTRRRQVRDRFLRRWMSRVATSVSAVSEGVMDALWWPDWRTDPRCEVVYLGVEIDRFEGPSERAEVRAELGLADDATVVAHVGNMGRPKNHPRLGRIFRALAERDPKAQLVLIGRRKPEFERGMLEGAGSASNRVHVLGPRADVPRLLMASDVFVFPSVTEGLPTAVLEARAARIPVVASDLPGIVELAHRIPGVRTLSLDQGDHAWRDACTAALAGPADTGENPLRDTVFDGEVSARRHGELWVASVR